MNDTGTHRQLTEFRRQWRIMTVYERYEQVVAMILAGVISVIVMISLLQLVRAVVLLLAVEALSPLDHAVFQTIFGMIMTLLIAMEFKHSIIRVALRRDHIVQVKTVILIAMLAVARKFIILDLEIGAPKIAALAGALLVLGIVYWLMQEREDCLERQGVNQPGAPGGDGERAARGRLSRPTGNERC
ncbi:MAG: phosphate-starvation-inducible PsiE family protein [Burkholderiales bacterium]|nr:phosphate-starvation-inducible PsiE family protein [Burkholderiales bacterium]